MPTAKAAVTKPATSKQNNDISRAVHPSTKSFGEHFHGNIFIDRGYTLLVKYEKQE